MRHKFSGGRLPRLAAAFQYLYALPARRSYGRIFSGGWLPYPAIAFLLLAGLFTACHTPETPPPAPFTTIDYVTVGKMMDTIRPPYIIDVSHGPKRVVLIGCDHNRDTTHPQFREIARLFNDLHPQLTFNEGGQIPDTLHFNSLNDGITHKGETGALKYLSNQAGIRMLNGDLTDSLEFSITLRKYPADQLLLYYLMERLVIPYLSGAYGNAPFEEIYNNAIQHWFIDEGFPVPENQRSFAGFKQLYQHYTGHPFELTLNEQIELFDYINGGDCQFCAIGRASKMVRDSVLLSKIDNALTDHDRVMITFGHGHAIALAPALQQVVDRH
ncbi:hypothetical protein F0L74_20210 [Chitinophaga agrisoli]|uniref:Uncharacterized protein n=1 Tax=Chitinophaga agrisoli TaxID=2607653 RepID=A0A5B2VJ39_9BACT|nr:hypothetical protein [Chitinophaga agrisoli]KAA2238550.1 hypothetical protein F0L74_20210 [Chitinophaga agrisoli]